MIFDFIKRERMKYDTYIPYDKYDTDSDEYEEDEDSE
jgi:hypothetical protein